MTQPPRRTLPLLGEARLSAVAARALTAELARHPGPKSALVVAVTASSPVLAAVLDVLGPDDTLTVVPLAGVTEGLAGLRVVGALTEADPADFVIVAEPVSGEAHEVRGYLDGLAKQ